MQARHSSPLTSYIAHCYDGKKVQVVFGSPKHDCDHMGVCRIEPDVFDIAPCQRGNKCTTGEAFLQMDEFGRMLIHFIKASLSPSTLDYYFRNGSFIVQDPYYLTNQVKALLDLPTNASFAIAPQHYPVLDTGSLLTISTRVLQSMVEQHPLRLAA